MRKIRMSNEQNRDATVRFASPKPEAPPKMGVVGDEVHFVRYLESTESGLNDALTQEFGEAYAQALIDGDPEIDIEVVGRKVGKTNSVYVGSDGAILFAPPKVIDIFYKPDGEERERRPAETEFANINEEFGLRWTKMRIKRPEVVRRFAFRRTLQLRHVDGLSYDFLYEMAKSLDEADEVVYIGAGAKGRDALVLQDNGSPYRGFLEGRIDGDKYQLLLHLSSLELKIPGEEA